MSEPKRYGDSDPQISCQEDDNGEYVLWTDYEKLRAENADLRAKMATMVCGTCKGTGWETGLTYAINRCPACQPADAGKNGTR